MAHQLMHCFEGHHVTTLGEITSNTGCHHEIQELDSINKVISEGKMKASEIRNNLKNLETTSTRLSNQYQKAICEVGETYQFYVSMLEERKAEITKELEQAYSSKQVALSVYSQKAQETVDKIFQVTDFVERLMKHASNGEVLMFKKPLDARLHQLVTYTPDLNLAALTELEFISNFQAIQVGVKNQFGYVKTKQELEAGRRDGSRQQPPISRPVGGTQSNCPPPPPVTSPTHSPNSGGGPLTSTVMAGMVQGLLDQPTRQSLYSPQFDSNALRGSRYSATPQPPPAPPFPGPNHLSSLLNGSSIADLANSAGLNPYEKWSNGSDNLFSGLSGVVPSLNQTPHHNLNNNNHHDALGERLSRSSQPNDSILDLSSKLMVGTSLSAPPMPPGTQMGSSSHLSPAMYPPKSQIKRQKMIYHCKFGEFGILEGQFTEPSGVAVNAQNDIIVADTNNHRIQIFDKEGRFKFQFGEVGKRDGQLLYPNRVAVVKTSGDIIVTERSPTHQIQIYNQYGQFVRKFGANILQHPRGVCVDNKGRIIVVECKVMRVIIFDQLGNLLNKFGCSKHLEFPNGVVVNDRQEIFISDNRAHCVKVFDYEGNFLRQIGGEGITNYPIGVGINAAGEITIADNHNNFNLSVFSQDGHLVSALESKVKHAQCFDVALMDDGSVVLASKDYRLYIYRYIQVPPLGL
jgi:tripartite motif-containing protein 2/3